MMRYARPLFLIAILGISIYLVKTYRERVAELRRNAPAAPRTLPRDTKSVASDWTWEKSSGDGPAVSVRARGFREIKAPSQFELEKVELKIYRQDGKTFDHVTTDKAIFDIAEKFLYSEGQADITMGVGEGEESAPHRLVRIQSSGIRFDSATGKAETEREATFQTARGEGRAVGAVYDPATKELLLKKQAQVIWADKGPKPRPMRVESDQMIYKETEQKVLLSPWAKLTRGRMRLEGAGAEVLLSDEGIREVNTTKAKGVDQQPGQTLAYSADNLQVKLNEKSEVERLEATGNARLSNTSAAAVTTTTANRVDMSFAATDNESILQNVVAQGGTVIESKPASRGDRPPGETKVLRSEVVKLQMRHGGQEIETLDTETPAVLEFLPNAAGQKKRRVDGERMHLTYGERNQLENLKVMQAATRTENEPKQGKPQPPSLTWSKEMQALFSPTGEMIRLEQWGAFRYEEGERKARSERALLDQAANRITLVQGARVWDNTGSTNADQIILDQRTEDFVADGHVTSSRLPERKEAKKGESGMLSGDAPLQAKAMKMTTFEKQTRILYEGPGSTLWQGADRITADRIEIDRPNSTLRADGRVTSQLLDRRKADPKAKRQTAQVYTIVNAPSLVYTDKDRLAHYTGGVKLVRPNLDVVSRELRAFLTPESKEPAKEGASEGTSLDRAFADGDVVIVQTAPGRTRKGTSQHAEYYPKEERIVLEKGDPVLEDSAKGVTRGEQLTYYANDERLLVNGVPVKPAVTKVRRK
ncbi:MAG: LPS export ABC transporter periplasmic protein LptC [Bryobacterales bacterium]|nr:LPS export ABC transporter periplasmic protein LptC [Bryobacterales bacterium]